MPTLETPTTKFEQIGTCVKCGQTNARVTYRPLSVRDQATEALVRTCGNCGYEWAEAPLDVAELVDLTGALEAATADAITAEAAKKPFVWQPA